jgi:nucleoside-diphosphate-sugar epimerase
MRVLLTGGYGCIGSWIARNLVERDDQVFIYDLQEDLHRIGLVLNQDKLLQIRFIRGDVTDLPGVRDALSQHRISHVIHLAGLQVPVCRANPLLGARVNVLGTLTVFEAVRQAQPTVMRLVYASSAAVYGTSASDPSGPLSEAIAPVPGTHYGVYKLCNEDNARVYFEEHGLSSIGLRPSTVYGVGRDFGMTSEPTKAIGSLAAGQPYHISYGGWQDLQFVDDVAKTFVRSLDAPYSGAKSYNLRGHVGRMEEFHAALCKVEPMAERLITFGDRQLPIAYDLDDGALQRDLGPIPRTPLEDGIRQTLEHFRRLTAKCG